MGACISRRRCYAPETPASSTSNSMEKINSTCSTVVSGSNRALEGISSTSVSTEKIKDNSTCTTSSTIGTELVGSGSHRLPVCSDPPRVQNCPRKIRYRSSSYQIRSSSYQSGCRLHLLTEYDTSNLSESSLTSKCVTNGSKDPVENEVGDIESSQACKTENDMVLLPGGTLVPLHSTRVSQHPGVVFGSDGPDCKVTTYVEADLNDRDCSTSNSTHHSVSQSNTPGPELHSAPSPSSPLLDESIKSDGTPPLLAFNWPRSKSLPSLVLSRDSLSEPSASDDISLQGGVPVQCTHENQDIDVHDTTSSGSESDDTAPCDGSNSKDHHSSHQNRHSLHHSRSQYKFKHYRHHSSGKHHRHRRKDRDENGSGGDGERSGSSGSWEDARDLSIVIFRKVDGIDTDLAIVVMKSIYSYHELKRDYECEGWKSEGLPKAGFRFSCEDRFSSEYSVFIHVSQYHYSDIGNNWKWRAQSTPVIPGSVIDEIGHGALNLQYKCTQVNRSSKSHDHGVTLEGLVMAGGCRAHVNYRLYWEGDVDSSSIPPTITFRDYFGRDSPLPRHVMFVRNERDEPFKLTKRVATNWKELANVLGLTKDITSIERDIRQITDEDRLREVLQHWFDNASQLPHSNTYPYTWKGLYEMLKDSGCEEVAKDYFRYLESIPMT